jgi:hypothetical protein
MLFTVLLTLCIFISFSYSLDVPVESDSRTQLSLPIKLSNPDGSETSISLNFSVYEKRLEFIVADFCEQKNVRSYFCRKLFETAMEMKLQQTENILKKMKLFPDQPPHSLDSPSLPRVTDSDSTQVPNSHLSRNPLAIQAELLHATHKNNHIESISAAERQITSQIQTNLDQIISEKGSLSRIIIIHSCLFQNQNPVVLERLLQSIQSSALLTETQAIFILHYGAKLPEAFLDNYSKRAISSVVIFYHVSDLSLFFEVPSIRIVHSISQYLSFQKRPLPAATTQVLYLHTKGSSYTQSYPQIDDWMNMMLYFLVERHTMVFHLLESKEFDAVGNNYCSHPRMFSGNFWWSTIQYLSTLRPLQYQTAGKYDAEQWLFQEQKIRIYVPHTSNVYHASIRYPEYCYKKSDDSLVVAVPSFEEFQKNCQEDNYEEYRVLHVRPLNNGISSLQEYEREQKRLQLDFANQQSISSVRCTAFDLYTVSK